MRAKPKCSACDADGLRYSVTENGWAATTAMVSHSFWDADGVYHFHDPNTTSRGYRCSNGHEWFVSEPHGCPAGDYPTITTVGPGTDHTHAGTP